MNRLIFALLATIGAAFAAAAGPPAEGLVKNPRFITATPDRKAPANYTLAGNVAWSYCGWGNEATDWGIALYSGKNVSGVSARAGSVSQDISGFEGGVGKWFRFSIRGLAEKNFSVPDGGLYLKVDYLGKNGETSFDGVTRDLAALVVNDRKELGINGDDRKDGGAVWKTYPFEFRLPFAEIDQLRLTVGFRGGDAKTEKDSAFFVTAFTLMPIPPPEDAPKVVKANKGLEPSLKNLIHLGGRWYYDPEPGTTAKTAKLVVDHTNAHRLFYMDSKLTTPFADNMTAWLRKGYKDADGNLLKHDRYLPNNVTVEFAGNDVMTIRTRGIPNHPTGLFPGPWGPGGWDPHYIQERESTYRIPLNPQPNPRAMAMTQNNANRAMPMGPIGVAVNGVVFFNPFDADSTDATTVMDRCCGHPAPGNQYHYHKYPVCVKSPFVDEGDEHSPLIGWALDGFPVYGPYEARRLMAKDDTAHPLNAFNVHFDEERGWHYHATPGKFPFMIGGYYGTADTRGMRRGPRPGRGEE